MKAQLLLFVFTLIVFLSANAQVLSGKVTDTQNVPIEDALVLHKLSNTHTHTNHSGVFQLEQIKGGDTLVVYRIGFEQLVISVNSVDTPMNIVLQECTVAIEDVIITEDIDGLNLFTRIDLLTAPVNNSQEILRKVPGLFIGQHAGGGKAEQLFLRGFDLDHGTDINLTADGMPVNMVSHAHGQGYADLHFIIPETIEEINFGKGPYNADQGNFATAGFVAFQTKERLAKSLVKLEAGQFNSKRLLGLFNLVNQQNQSAYIATDFITNDGPFESPQNFRRNNTMVKYSVHLPDQSKISALLSHFSSSWDASGQVPQRAIDSGLITRFGAIDNREGGSTQRSNFKLDYTKKLSDNSVIKNTVYYSLYDFELYSNFTFFLEDSINGDQIKQKEKRQMFGLKSELKSYFNRDKMRGSVEVAVGLRSDRTNDSELSHTAQRTILLKPIQFGDIDETNYFSYVNTEIKIGKWLINPAVRVDYFESNYYNKLVMASNTNSTHAAFVSPKLNILYNFSKQLQVYLKTGNGFHSNDTRVVLQNASTKTLTSARGMDLGFISKPKKNVIVSMAAWYLFLEQEFVYVGDAGIVEPSGRTQRFGFDVGVRYQINDWIHLNADANKCIARAISSDEGNSYIPLAPDFTFTGGLNLTHPKGFYAGMHVRVLNNRPANEDYSMVAKGYTIMDANAGYLLKRLDVAITVENVLNTEWNETQFATTSRLQGEQTAVEEIHFTPGIPFFMKGSVAYKF